MNLADDPRTLSMMGELTFRQKGEALCDQFKRNCVWHWLQSIDMAQAQQNAQLNGMSQFGGQQSMGGLGALVGGILGAANPFQGLP